MYFPSMMAVREGATHVFGCEVSHVMVKLSHDVAPTNHMSDKLSVLHAQSTDLTVPKDLPNRYSP